MNKPVGYNLHLPDSGLKVDTDLVVEDDKVHIIHNIAEVDALLAQNREMRALNGKGIRRKNGCIKGGALAREVAELDMITFMKLEALGILNDKKAMSKWLNDPENKAFRTSEGKV
jgi:hypothetical protein